MSQVHSKKLIPTGYTPPPPPGNPGYFFLSERVPVTRQIFGLIPCPGAKMMVKFPGMGQNFPKLEETAP